MNRRDIQLLFDHEFFSPLALHFAKLMVRLSGRDLPELFLASALVSRATSEGHVCLDLSAIAGKSLVFHGPESGNFSCPDLKKWRKSLISCGAVGGPSEFKPLILDDRSRLYLYRYWQYENSLAEQIKARARKTLEGVDPSRLRDALSRCFGPSKENEIDWQKVAAFVCLTGAFSVISGGPGTGKSTLVSKILTLVLDQAEGREVQVALAAPTGKAAARLQEAIKDAGSTTELKKLPANFSIPEASTIHRLLGTIPGSPYFRHTAQNPLPFDLVVIDEASMVDLALMSKLVQAVPSSARLILLGDRDQLASVQAGAVLGDICNTGHFQGFSRDFCDRFQEISGDPMPGLAGTAAGPLIRDRVVQLKKSYRFGPKSGIGELSRIVNEGDGQRALKLLKSGGYPDIGWKPLPAPPSLSKALRQEVLQEYRSYLKAKEPAEAFLCFDRYRILCALRKGPYGVSSLNLLIEQLLREENLIQAEERWYPGRPVLIRKNDYNLKLFNGDVGIILADPASADDLRAFFVSPDGALRKLLPIRLPEHETAYAMTVHQSQGSEFDRAALILPDPYTPVVTRELIYTAITRAKKGIELWGREEIFLEGVRRRTERASGLRDALWGEG